MRQMTVKKKERESTPNIFAGIVILIETLQKSKDVEEREEKRGRPFHPMCKDCLSNRVPVVYTKEGKLVRRMKRVKKTENGWTGGISGMETNEARR